MGVVKTEIHERVLRNIELSKIAREKSNFPILSAKINQINSGYSPDSWEMTSLKKGDFLFGGLPGQSAYYTDEKSVLLSDFEKEPLFQSLQVKPNENFGYRSLMGKYILTKNIDVPSSIVKANPNLGSGFAKQFFINNFGDQLDLVDTIELRSIYDNRVQPNRPGY